MKIDNKVTSEVKQNKMIADACGDKVNTKHFEEITYRELLDILPVHSAVQWGQLVNIFTEGKVTVETGELMARIFCVDSGKFFNNKLIYSFFSMIEEVDTLEDRMKSVINMTNPKYMAVITGLFYDHMTHASCGNSVNLNKTQIANVVKDFTSTVFNTGLLGYVFSGVDIVFEAYFINDKNLELGTIHGLVNRGIYTVRDLDKILFKVDDNGQTKIIKSDKFKGEYVGKIITDLEQYGYINDKKIGVNSESEIARIDTFGDVTTIFEVKLAGNKTQKNKALLKFIDNKLKKLNGVLDKVEYIPNNFSMESCYRIAIMHKG